MPGILRSLADFGLLTFTVVAGLAVAVHAGDGRCTKCGCTCECQKVCRLVCEQKKVTVTCWGCKHEDFCVPGPSKPDCQHCEWVCDENSDAKTPCVQPKKFVWTDWIPSCDAKLHTRTKLMKKTVTKKIPSYKWVVEDLCAKCEKDADLTEIPPDVAVPLPPVVNVSTK